MSDDPITGEGFQDPLENYDPKTYDDPLEEAIAEQTVALIQHKPHASISPDATVAEAVEMLSGEHVGCLLVEEDGKLVGVFTDREVLNKVALEPGAVEQPVRALMTKDPAYVYEDDPPAAALCVMAVSGFRHVPVVDGDEHALGIISPQRVTGFLTKYIRG